MTVLLTERMTSFHDRTQFDENVAVLMSDFIRLAKSLIKLAEENGVNKEAIQNFEGRNQGCLSRHWQALED